MTALLVGLALLLTLWPGVARAQGGCCQFAASCIDFKKPFPEAEQECRPGVFTPPPATCAMGCVPLTRPRPTLPTEAQLDLHLSASGAPEPFFTSGQATTFALGLNAVKGTAQLYSATLFLDGFRLELPGALQEAGRLEVQTALVTLAFPLRVLDANALWVDLNGNTQYDPGEPTIDFRQGSIIMVVTVPFGGDGDPATHDVQTDARVTLRGTFLRPVTPDIHAVRAILTTVDPDTGGPDDGAGVAPRVMVVDRSVEIRPREVAIDVRRDRIRLEDARKCHDRRKVRVAIRTADTFDARTVDPATVRLGDPRLGGTAPPTKSTPHDVRHDKARNLEVRFAVCDLVRRGALDANTTELALTGQTREGFAIAGRDSVRVVVKRHGDHDHDDDEEDDD